MNHLGSETRRIHVRELVEQGETASKIQAELERRGVVNPTSGKPYSLATVVRDMQALVVPQIAPVSEMIGRTAAPYVQPMWPNRAVTSIDLTRTDYGFWDRLRNGRADGFKFGGLYCKPLTQILSSFVWPNDVAISLTQQSKADDYSAHRIYTDGLLTRFTQRLAVLMQTVLTDLYALGDQYVIINHDGSLSIPSPDTVKVETDKLDYRHPIKYTVVTQMDKIRIEDSYTASQRILKLFEAGNREPYVKVYPNLIGRIPVTHLANDRSANEIFGRPVYEALYHLFKKLDILIEKALDGVELMGNPLPVFEGMEDINATIQANATNLEEEYDDPDGYLETRELIRFDTNGAVIVGKGGSFKFASPLVGFTTDIVAIIKQLFLMVCSHTRIPQFMYGGSIEGEKDDAELQLPVFVKYIEGRQRQLSGLSEDELLGATARGGVLELVDIWLRMRRLVDPRIVVAPATVKFPHMTTEDAQTALQKTIYARGQKSIRKATMLDLLKLVQDPRREVELATEEAEKEAKIEAKQAEKAKKALDQASYADTDPDKNESPTKDTPEENPAGGRRGSDDMTVEMSENRSKTGQNLTHIERFERKYGQMPETVAEIALLTGWDEDLIAQSVARAEADGKRWQTRVAAMIVKGTGDADLRAQFRQRKRDRQAVSA